MRIYKVVVEASLQNSLYPDEEDRVEEDIRVASKDGADSAMEKAVAWMKKNYLNAGKRTDEDENGKKYKFWHTDHAIKSVELVAESDID